MIGVPQGLTRTAPTRGNAGRRLSNLPKRFFIAPGYSFDEVTEMQGARLLRAAIVCAALLIAGQTNVRAQSSIPSRIDDAARQLAHREPRFRLLDAVQRRRLMEFIVGNTLFITSHELGHAVLSSFELPVLGGHEKAADVFATLALLHIGTDYAHSVLVDAARGLILLAERDARLGQPLRFYEEHGLDQQRAYQIVCLMFGSDPAAFTDLAERTRLPPERRETCVQELLDAQDSWIRMLKPHFRTSAPGKPSFLERLLGMAPGPQRREYVEVSYAEAPPRLAVFKEALINVAVLETVRDFATANFAFSKRVTIEAKSCGEAGAYWKEPERHLVLCYELVADYAELAIRLGL
jgi:hypothetical protein